MKRGRPPIKLMIKRLITEKALENRKMPRPALTAELIKLIEEMGEIAPSEETIKRLISHVRNSPETPLDAPFSLGAVIEHGIPADAIPMLLKMQYLRPMTIREARWAAKLYIFAQQYLYADFPEFPMLLHRLAADYALRERGCEFQEVPCDTSDLDELFLRPVTDIDRARQLVASMSQKEAEVIKEIQRRKRDTE